MAAGLLMCWTAFPVAVASLVEMHGNPSLERAHADLVPEAALLHRLVGFRERAAEWRDTGRTRMDIALGYLMLAAYGDPAQRREHAELAEAALAAGLRLTPMSPYGWARLVQVRTMRGSPASEVALPLRLALRSGPQENRRTEMLLLAVETGLRVWSHLDAGERRLIARKAHQAWRRDAVATAGAGARAGKSAQLASLLGF